MHVEARCGAADLTGQMRKAASPDRIRGKLHPATFAESAFMQLLLERVTNRRQSRRSERSVDPLEAGDFTHANACSS